MSDPNESSPSGPDRNAKRNLPSWMSSRADDSKSSGKKKPMEKNEGNSPKKVKEREQHRIEKNKKPSPPNYGASDFSNLLEGVVFALSGFVNPERSVLRSQCLEMGAEYQPDWNHNCTLLICAFPNTPKFRQVEAEGGTIVSKDWISECHSQKKLVDIESYLMHVGKPWRRQKESLEASEDIQSSVHSASQKQFNEGSQANSTSKGGISNHDRFSPSKVKKWAIVDLNKTISWLESQEQKPEASEVKNIAAEGILTCLQDAIDILKEKQDIQQIMEQWSFIPRAVEELAKLDSSASSKTKEELCKEAMACKRIYEAEFSHFSENLVEKSKRPRTDSNKKGSGDYDSDETIEMTEEEIDLAYNTVTSQLGEP